MQHLSFEQVSYTVEGKQVLVGVSGQAHAGRLLAIMGPSGAGKVRCTPT
jgi:ABC-type hemin transport system ATPase subunit